MKNKLWKLAKMLIQFKEYITEQGKLIVSGDLIEGTEVAIENENGELVPVTDGEYKLDDVVVVVVDGKITEIKQEVEPKPEPEPEPVEEPLAEDPKQDPDPEVEPEPDEKDLRIEELEGLLKDRDAVIEELTAKIKELEDKLNKPVEDPVKMAATVQDKNTPQSGALKYFQR
jgi:hypothetical protein